MPPRCYRKAPKFLDVRKLCCNLPKIQIKKPNLRVFCQKDANGIANSVDTGAKEQSDLGLHCLPRPICPKAYDHYGIPSFFIFKISTLYISILQSCTYWFESVLLGNSEDM